MRKRCFADVRRLRTRRLRQGLVLLLLCLSCLSCGASGAGRPFYAELLLPRSRAAVRDTSAVGLLQLLEQHAGGDSICFEASVSLQAPQSRSLFLKLDHRCRLTARWTAAGDTLQSRPFVLSRVRSDVVIRTAAPDDRLRVHHVRYFLPRYRGRLSVVLAAGAAAWALKVLVAWLVLVTLDKPRRVLRVAAPLAAATTLLCYCPPMNLAAMLLLPVLAETAVLGCCCRKLLGLKDAVRFTVLTQVCSFGLIHLGSQLPVFM